MGKILLRVEGLDGQIELMNDRVVIHRRGLWNTLKYGFHAKREIPLMALSEVSFKEPTIVTFGEIDFVRSGRSQDDRKKKSSSAVKFRKKQLADFEEFKEKTFEMMEQHAKTHH